MSRRVVPAGDSHLCFAARHDSFDYIARRVVAKWQKDERGKHQEPVTGPVVVIKLDEDGKKKSKSWRQACCS